MSWCNVQCFMYSASDGEWTREYKRHFSLFRFFCRVQQQMQHCLNRVNKLSRIDRLYACHSKATMLSCIWRDNSISCYKIFSCTKALSSRHYRERVHTQSWSDNTCTLALSGALITEIKLCQIASTAATTTTVLTGSLSPADEWAWPNWCYNCQWCA